jgi:predicted flap endonuclease-1-like 5' DNA nuclease
MSFMSFPESDTRRAASEQAPVYPTLFDPVWWTPWAWFAWWQPARSASIPPAPSTLPEVSAAQPVQPASAVSVPDDLTRIEGIGPKIAVKLGAAGITTYAALAGTPVDRLKGILAAAGPRFKLARPQTWPEQAALLAAGDEAGFSALAAELRGGVRP